MSIVKSVEFVDELVDGVASFGDGAQVGDKGDVVALHGVIRLELRIVHERETVNETFDVTQNLVISLERSCGSIQKKI